MRRRRLVQPDPEFIRAWHANLEAKMLRDQGMSYSGIAVAMRVYHGVDRTVDEWQGQLRKQGCPPSKGLAA
jgi:hypothetical protein